MSKLGKLKNEINRINTYIKPQNYSKPFYYYYYNHGYVIKWKLYRPLIKFSPSDNFTAMCRSQFRLYSRKKRGTVVHNFLKRYYHYKSLLNNNGKHGNLIEISNDWFNKAKQEEIDYEIDYVKNKLFKLNSYKKVRLTGSLIYPTPYNPPLPRMKPQPLEIHKMIRRRVLHRGKLLIKLNQVNDFIEYLKLESKFLSCLDLKLNKDYLKTLLISKKYLIDKLNTYNQRAQLKFSIRDLKRFKTLHSRRVNYRYRSMDWRKRNHPRLIKHTKEYNQKVKDERIKTKKAIKGLKFDIKLIEKPKVNNNLYPRIRNKSKFINKQLPMTSLKGLFNKPLNEVYNPNNYNDNPLPVITYDFSKKPQSLTNNTKITNKSLSKWSK